MGQHRRSRNRREISGARARAHREGISYQAALQRDRDESATPGARAALARRSWERRDRPALERLAGDLFDEQVRELRAGALATLALAARHAGVTLSTDPTVVPGYVDMMVDDVLRRQEVFAEPDELVRAMTVEPWWQIGGALHRDLVAADAHLLELLATSDAECPIPPIPMPDLRTIGPGMGRKFLEQLHRRPVASDGPTALAEVRASIVLSYGRTHVGQSN